MCLLLVFLYICFILVFLSQSDPSIYPKDYNKSPDRPPTQIMGCVGGGHREQQGGCVDATRARAAVGDGSGG
jgi:hypothetical protein